MKRHTFIMIRYSVLTESRGSWKVGRDVDEKEYKRKLFSEERLRFRCDIFKSITLPSLLEMDMFSTTVFIFISTAMPSKYKNEIKEMVSLYPWIKVIPLSPQGKLIGKMNKVLLDELDQIGDEVCYATVRLDDDDALSKDFSEMIGQYINPANRGFAVSFPAGFAGFLKNGKFEKFHYINQPKIALGLSFIQMYSPKDKTPKPVSVFSLGNHTKIDSKVPVILDSRSLCYIRTVHEKSDAYNDNLVKRLTSGEVFEVDDVRLNFPV